MLKLGEMSFGMLKLGELGEVSCKMQVRVESGVSCFIAIELLTCFYP